MGGRGGRAAQVVRLQLPLTLTLTRTLTRTLTLTLTLTPTRWLFNLSSLTNPSPAGSTHSDAAPTGLTDTHASRAPSLAPLAARTHGVPNT